MGVAGVGVDGVVVVIEVKESEQERQRWWYALLLDAHHIGGYSWLEPLA